MGELLWETKLFDPHSTVILPPLAILKRINLFPTHASVFSRGPKAWTNWEVLEPQDRWNWQPRYSRQSRQCWQSRQPSHSLPFLHSVLLLKFLHFLQCLLSLHFLQDFQFLQYLHSLLSLHFLQLFTDPQFLHSYQCLHFLHSMPYL